jgi:general secretion pathway protein D
MVWLTRLCLLGLLLVPMGALAAPDSPEDEAASASSPTIISRQKPPEIGGAKKITLDFVDTSIWDMVKFFADLTGKNFIIADQKELSGKKVTVISHKPVTVGEAWEAFLSSLEVSGYTISTSGRTNKVVKSNEAIKRPLTLLTEGEPHSSDQFVTQLIPLANISASEVTKVVNPMVSSSAKVISYESTNTLIITEAANNIRKIMRLLQELDIAAPKSRLEIVPIVHAEASEIKQIIEELYGTESASSSSRGGAKTTSRTPSRRSRRSSREEPAPVSNEAVTAGSPSKYISKVLSDERTNSLIVLANDQGHQVVADLVADLDVDIDLASRSQIHVVRLEHAKAEEVAKVLNDLSQGGGGSGRGNNKSASKTANKSRQAASAAGKTVAERRGDSGEDSSGALAAFDSGMRIAPDEQTNSLIILASNDDFEIVYSVIEELDVVRRQVFVDAVILEVSSIDDFSRGIAYHGPFQPDSNALGFLGASFGTSSLGLSQDLLSGLAVGAFGPDLEVPMMDGSSLSIPAFGVVLHAMKSNQSVNIVSNPNLMTLDNQKAKMVVGRKIPFPTTSGLNNLGQPVVSFQREDVAITLQVTPRVNSSNFVTLELEIEVQEIEEDAKGLNIQQSGFITSKRKVETVALVKDNQTVVLGGLVGSTETEAESKIPILGDLPLIGAFFRSSTSKARRTNLMVFLTPHIIDDEQDMVEVMRIKEAQRQEFVRRFYGKSREEQIKEMGNLLQYSMNAVDQPSLFRGPTDVAKTVTLAGERMSDSTRSAIQEALDEVDLDELGDEAGELPEGGGVIILEEEMTAEPSSSTSPTEETPEPQPETPAPADAVEPPADAAETGE